MQRPKSEKIFARSSELIPGGVNSPVRAFKDFKIPPIVAKSGYRDLVQDADGNRYIDFCCSWGALIHGHAPPQVVEAAIEKVKEGSSFGMTTEIEALLAEKITSLMPSLEKIRFVSSGTEATMTAVRLARGFTGRGLVIKFSGNYHGHSDGFLVEAGSGVAALSASSSQGVLKEAIASTLSLPFNAIEAVEEVFKNRGDSIAAVILEPIACNMGLIPAETGFLEKLRKLTSEYGALLIFDEVITGFRVGLGGAQALYGVFPDLTCLGKIIGGGFPAAAVGGKKEIMDFLAPVGPVYQAGTLSGNPVAMAAGLAALELCEKPRFYQTLEEKGAFLCDPIQRCIEEEQLELRCHRVGSLFTLFFSKSTLKNFEDVKRCDLDSFGDFFKALLAKGIYFSPSQFEANFISSAHSLEHLEYARGVIQESLQSRISV